MPYGSDNRKRDGEISEGRGTGLRFRDGSERPGEQPKEGAYDFEMRGSDGHRLAPDMAYGLRRPAAPIGRPFMRTSDDQLYATDARGANGEFLPDGIVIDENSRAPRFGADQTANEDNKNPIRGKR